MNARKFDLVIWDWNGTLLDDTEMCYGIANEMLIERGMSRMQGVEEYRRHFMFPVIDYYRRMGYTFETEPFENISRQFCGDVCGAFPGLRAAALRPKRAFVCAGDWRAAGAPLRHRTGKARRAGCTFFS